ncbi:NACHT domain-containing protein [Kutzneria sp. NPDC051319]|uniref:NACHT domain-containing protein n=1 Tax=Kutzneria sp. NPDC051319 TaxID=3155047 RepID=UPI00343BA67F
MLDTLGLALGKQIVLHVAKAWLGDRRSRIERETQLADLVELSTVDRLVRRKLVRQLEQIGDTIAERIMPTMGMEIHNLPSNERQSALDAVVDALSEVDLTDTLIFSSDLKTDKLARAVLQKIPDIPKRAGLSEAAITLFDLVLQESCSCMAGVIIQLPAFQPRAAVELLARLTSVLDGINQVLERLPRPTLAAPSGDALDAEFARDYLSYISQTMDQLELFGVDIRRYRPQTSVTVAYLSLTVSGSTAEKRTRESNPDWLPLVSESAVEASSRVEFALAGSKRTLLRGQAGSGKTTLLQWISVTAARGNFGGPLTGWNGKIPFVVRLRSYPDGRFPQLYELVAENAAPLASLEPENWTVRRFMEGNAILLIDGVDELRLERRPKVRKWLSELLIAFPDTDVIVTSRPGAAEPNWLKDQGFTSLFLEPMKPSDIVEFSHRWHAAIRDWGAHVGNLPCEIDELDEYESSLLRQLESQRHLRTLATSPLLCAMLCALNLDRHKQLPQDQMRLYGSALELLLERRDAEREVSAAEEITMSAVAKVTILQHLAWWLTLCARSEAAIPEAVHQISSAIIRIPEAHGLEATPVLRYLLDRSGVIREPVQGKVDFVHRTFQEYLAGKYAADEHYADVLVRNAHLDQWRETVIMSVGHASVPIRKLVIEAILDRASGESRHGRKLRLLACAALDMAPVLDRDTIDKVEDALSRVAPPRRRVEARSLARVGDRVLRHLPLDLTEKSTAVAAACVRTAIFIGGDAAIKLLGTYALDDREDVQSELAWGWDFAPSERYAREVLAEAPLSNGKIHIGSLAHIRNLRFLKNLDSVNVFVQQLPGNDLTPLAGECHIVSFITNIDGVVDLSPVVDLDRLRILRFGGHGKLVSLESLVELRSLEQLSLMNCDSVDAAKVARCHALRWIDFYGAEANEVDLKPFADHPVPLTICVGSRLRPVNVDKLGTNVKVVDEEDRRKIRR